jgi:ribosomal protein L37AE/L43A
MTFERKMVASLDDIKAVTFECAACKSQTTVRAENLDAIPYKCGYCNSPWLTPNYKQTVTSGLPLAETFITCLAKIRAQESPGAFKIFLEFDEPNAK